MSRIFTISDQQSGDILLSGDQNKEINQAVSELNGGLDGNNMPLESITRGKFVQPVVDSSNPLQDNYIYPSQTYFISDECENISTIQSTDWQLGWNKFEQLTGGADPKGFVLNFEAKEGMLKGEACIDFEHRMSIFLYVYDPPADPPIDGSLTKDEHSGELGVFVNDVLVARTGPVWIAGGRHSYVIPWSTPIGSGPTHVDVRWSIDFKNIKFTPTGGGIYTFKENHINPINVYSRMLWTRNEYR